MHSFSAFVLALLFGVSYVLPFYFEPKQLLPLTRNHDPKIKYRIATSTASTVICSAVAMMTTSTFSGANFPGSLFAAALGCALVWIIYSGHVFAIFFTPLAPGFEEPFELPFWQVVRNLIAAPITEELVFRGAIISVLVEGHYPLWFLIWGSPLFFGLAHLHHAIQHVQDGYSARQAAITVVFQLVYTTIFGAFAAFLYLRTGHIAAAIAAHSMCNYFGFPCTAWITARRHTVRDKILLSLFYIAGLIAFAELLFPLTRPKMFRNSIWDALVAGGIKAAKWKMK
mmetsp:Transcript_24013/g.77117  ORF Transcript_24013/g.77117 Transcript_24013/m.77117 type:complete len:284 (-) Transcript_24013:2835-3686(-)